MTPSNPPDGLIRIVDSTVVDAIALVRNRNQARDKETERSVAQIIEDVRTRGDAAVLEIGRKFDSPELDSLVVSESEIDRAVVSSEEHDAILDAIARVRAFHERQLNAVTSGLAKVPGGYGWNTQADPHSSAKSDLAFGLGTLGQRLIPMNSAGVYVPGGGAPYASSVIMNTVPALVAGVPNVVVASPPARDGNLASAVLCAMREVGTRVAYKMGGAAAVAALALGTESVGKVDMIAGPGNRFVNEAKRQLWGVVGLDGLAGSSEVCVIVDDDANPQWAAADLLTQVEHAEDNVGFLIATSTAQLHAVLDAVNAQLTGAARESTMRQALKHHGLAVLVRDLAEGFALVNAIAPEHVTVAVRDPETWLPRIENAGCVLLGEFTPESAGDYGAGPSHTLPTGGAARFASPLNVMSFMRWQSVAHLSGAQLETLSPTIQAFGQMEGFPAHARGASIRFAP